MSNWKISDVLLALQENKTRATYGAVAQVVGATAFSVMSGCPRDPLHSWVVNKLTGDPTKYRHDQKHPDLYKNDRVIESPDTLESLLESYRQRSNE